MIPDPPIMVVTVDLEDWFQVENLRAVYPRGKWDSCELHVKLNTHVLLDLFDHYRIQATFFVLGWIAERCPQLISDIHARGHEVASHGYNHQLCSQLSDFELREDIRRAKQLLEGITGMQVKGYRAPSFSITDSVLQILRELGHEYDSSYNDAAAVNGNYGKIRNSWSRRNGHFTTASGLIELPVSNLKADRWMLPWGGGGYFRFWPSSLFNRGVGRILRSNGHYVFYFHPWELDSVQPKTRKIGMLKHFRHYVHLSDTFHRINLFFSTFRHCRFMSCISYLTNGEITKDKSGTDLPADNHLLSVLDGNLYPNSENLAAMEGL